MSFTKHHENMLTVLLYVYIFEYCNAIHVQIYLLENLIHAGLKTLFSVFVMVCFLFS